MNTPRTLQRGLTMVELLIGMAIGLFIVAAATSLLTGNLRESRKLMIESRLMQDLRTAADMITRDLRRAGYWAAANTGVRGDGTSALLANPYTDVTPVGASADNTSFRFSRDTTENHTVDSNEQFAFRLRNGSIELQLGAGNWQALTDAATLTVTEFSVTPTVEEISLASFCTSPCPAGSAATCPPRQLVRSLAVVISGQATSDARVMRSVRSQVRLRNDPIVGTCHV
jgi:prepilin peptidase dependent protein B